MDKKTFSCLAVLLVFNLALASCTAPAAAPAPTEPAAVEPTGAPGPTEAESQPEAGSSTLILATTTSTEDSGLLAVLLPDFEREFGVSVDVIAVGTGQALTLGQDGNADVLLVHARAREDEFMAAGHGVRREDVMYNDFVILGPEDDPAGIQAASSAVEAFQKIAESEATFISRGDESGTHTKELSVWQKAGIEPAGDWYISSGQGMGEVLTMSNEQQAYTLSDRATYLARSKEGLDLVVVNEGDPDLFNPYGVIAVDPSKNPAIHADLANQFIDWIISVPVQEKIAQFGMDEFGQSLFIPDSQPWRDAQGGESAGQETETMDVAGPQVTGMVDSELSLAAADFASLETISVAYTNKDGETTDYTGAPINALLGSAGLGEGAVTLVFVAGDGFTS